MDLTVVAIPAYFGGMGAEHIVLKRRAAASGPSVGEYERNDTIASLAVGTASLVAPIVMSKLLRPITPGRGRYGKALVATAVGAAVVTTVADMVARAEPSAAAGERESVGAPIDAAADNDWSSPPPARERRRRLARLARRVQGLAGVAAVVTGGVAVATTWASRTTADRMWKRRVVRDLGRGPLTVASAILAWDFIYYWNHRMMHESRFLWAIHVVHHSSERYNLSTALRQPVADALGTFLPSSALALIGIQPALIETARGVNLLYQFWIHTDAIGKLGPIEKLFNTPSHHRVHHGSNRQYLDRNHGSILIIWDRLFGTYEVEDEPVVYGLTKNINSHNLLRITSHEHADMLRDIRSSTTWHDRLSFLVRGPGWAYARHAASAESALAAGVV